MLECFLDYKNKLPFQIRGGVKMYDVKGHYKWLDLSELFDYYTKNQKK